MTAQLEVKGTIIDLKTGDITHQDVDAIVNAANRQLAGGGGVDGAIHRAAGWEQLQAACRQIGGCDTGQAVITPGFNLKARYVIHAVGPIYRPDDPQIPRLLASAYQRSLEVAVENELQTIAFPAISTGVYGYPMQQAAEIALRTAVDFAESDDQLTLIRFVLFSKDAFDVYRAVLG